MSRELAVDPDGEVFVRNLLAQYGEEVLSLARKARRQHASDDLIVFLLETVHEVFITVVSRRAGLDMAVDVEIPDIMIAAMTKPAGRGYFWLVCVSDEGHRVSCMRAAAFAMVKGGAA